MKGSLRFIIAMPGMGYADGAFAGTQDASPKGVIRT
jgi:hypothetical protein